MKKVVACSEADELITLGLTAAQCMKEVTVDIETKEFKYQTTEQETHTVSSIIMIPCLSLPSSPSFRER